MDNKVLKIDMYQPFAHYRHPKVMQDDYITTLNIPCATTVVGMLSYISDIRFEKKVDVGIVTKYSHKQTNFIRGEVFKFWETYLYPVNDKDFLKNESWKRVRKKYKKNFHKGNWYFDFKQNYVKNRVMNFEVLTQVQHTIFIKSDIRTLLIIKEVLNNPKRYISLGRKEDFAIVGKKIEKKNKNFRIQRTLADIVDIEESYMVNTADAIKKNIKLSNTYVKIDLNKEDDEILLGSGNLLSLPQKYKNLKTDKKDRVLEFGHYIELGDNGYFPRKRKVNIYNNQRENIVFTWLVGD